jgi:hypothetical protein
MGKFKFLNPVNQRVAGSSPAGGADIKIKGLYFDSITLFTRRWPHLKAYFTTFKK